MKIKLNKVLVLVLILALTATTVYALPNNDRGNGPEGAPGQIKKQAMFNDMEGWQWAERFIERMAKKNVIKGVGNGAFMPSNTAKEIETIAMLIRELGLEDELDDDAELPEDYNGKKPDGWMVPYIELANDEDIYLITDEELETFDPNYPTKRSKAAVYFVRAADILEGDDDYVDEAEENMDKILPYKDFNSIPEEHIGYVYVASELGLLQGYPGGTFQANKAINRAELAAMMARLDENYETDSSYVLFAKIEDIDLEDEEITLKSIGKEETYDLPYDVDVYIDDEEADLEDLEINMVVKVYFEDNKIIEISFRSDDEDFEIRYIGEIVDFSEDFEEITIKEEDDDEFTFLINDKTKIRVTGFKNELNEDLVGLDVIIIAKNDTALEVWVYPHDRKELGKLFNKAEDLDEDNYTDVSWENFEDALEDAEDVLDDPQATQDEIEEALEDLEEAIEDLVYTVTDLEIEDEYIVTKIDNDDKVITVVEGITVEDLLDAVESEFNASFLVLEEDGDPVEDDDTEVTEDMVLEVTADDNDTVAVYEIVVETE